MDYKKQDRRTLTNDQIRVTESVRSATDILRSSQPYLDAAMKSMKVGDRTWQEGDPVCEPVSVPPQILRDLIVMLATQVKLGNGLAVRHDRGDGDWNPFNGIDFEFD